MNRIAYVSPKGDLFTVDPDGSGLLQLTGGFHAQSDIPELSHTGGVQVQPLQINEFYTWVTWCADGTKLAASKVVLNPDRPEVSVQILDAQTGNNEIVYRNGLAGLIAEGAPHYIYWAPIGDQLSFLAATPDGLSLFVWDGIPGHSANLVDRGAPLYYQGSPDAQSMAIHLGPEIIWMKSPIEGGSRESFRSPGNFRALSISPDGQTLAYVDESDNAFGSTLGDHVTKSIYVRHESGKVIALTSNVINANFSVKCLTPAMLPENLQIGDEVDSPQGKTKVTDIIRKQREGYYILEDELEITNDHPILIDGEWILAEEYQGKKECIDEPTDVIYVEIENELLTVKDWTVGGKY